MACGLPGGARGNVLSDRVAGDGIVWLGRIRAVAEMVVLWSTGPCSYFEVERRRKGVGGRGQSTVPLDVCPTRLHACVRRHCSEPSWLVLSHPRPHQVDNHIRELDTELNQFEIEHAAGLTDPRHEKRGRRRDLQSESERLEDMYVLFPSS